MTFLRVEPAMTDIVVHLSGAARRRAEFAAPLERSLYRASIADGTRRALDELPDNLLRDIGLARDDVPFVAGELAFPRGDLTRGRAARPSHGVVLGLAAGTMAAVLRFVGLSS
jgi:uncharacterized protein YjiS (DUF1127 family)